MDTYIDISWSNLLYSFLLVLLALLLSLIQKLQIFKSIIISSLRCFFQLSLMGYALHYIFALNNPLVVLAVLVFMVLFGGYEASRRVEGRLPGRFLIAALSIFAGILLPLITTLWLVVAVKPWYKPQYFIPLASMIVTSALNSSALTLNRLVDSMHLLRPQLEAALALGATRLEAAAFVVKRSVKAGLLPSVNSLRTVGVVHIPGIMTGQILSGVAPVEAAKYQILIMYILLAATIVSASLSGLLATLQFFTRKHQLRYHLIS